MIVKSFVWCAVTGIAVLAAAFSSAAPVHATNNNGLVKNPSLVVIAGGCVEPGIPEGTFDVTLTNPNPHDKTYTITVGSEQKELTVPAGGVNDIAFTELSAGDYTVEVAGPYGTSASATASIVECHEDELAIVSVDSCNCVAPGAKDGNLNLSITNPNDYAVTYTVQVGWRIKDVFVDAQSTQHVSFGHLRAGEYNIVVNGDDCTTQEVKAIVEQCPEEEPQPGQPGQGGGMPVQEPVVAQAPTAQTPAELPDTSAAEAANPVTTVAVAAPAKAQTFNVTSLLLIALGAPLVAYAAIRQRQLNR